EISVAFIVIKTYAISAFRLDDSRSDGEVGASIIVIICPRCAECVDRPAQTRARRDVRKSRSSFVVKKEKPPSTAPAVAGHEHVLETVIVVVNELRCVTTKPHWVVESYPIGHIFEPAVASIAEQTKRRAFRSHKNVFSAIAVEIAPRSAAAQRHALRSASLGNVAQLKRGAIPSQHFQSKLFRNFAFRLSCVKRKRPQHPSIPKVARRVAAGLKRKRNAFGVSFQPQINSRDCVRNYAGPLFHCRSQNFESLFKLSSQQRMLRFLVLREVREIHLRGKKMLLDTATPATAHR